MPAVDPDLAFLSDPRGFTEKRLKAFEEQRATELLRHKCDVSEMIAESKHDDYKEAVSAFDNFVKNNPQTGPAYVQEMLRSNSPAEYAYAIGKQIKSASAYGSTFEEMESAIEAKVRAKVAEEMSQQQQSLPQPNNTRPPLSPKSIASARGSGPGVKQPWKGPKPISEMFKRG
jgi:hypothetical protein